jgi:DNA adenine methylase
MNLDSLESLGESSPRFPSARPFIKWAGSKQSLLHHILPYIPEKFNRYFEPFIGAGSLFLNLAPQFARLSDLSVDLVSLWVAIKDNPETIIQELEGLTPDRDKFYQIRGNRSTDPIIRSAEFIYLNKSCWNGLYRVNKSGGFNVPFGSNEGSPIIDAENIRRCSKILNFSNAEISVCDFEEATSSAASGDFVFFDPPYVTKHNFNGFRDYNEKLFSWNDQERLAKEARRLRDIGVYVVVTNAAHPDVRELYRGFPSYEFERSSTLASRSEHRGKVGEIIFYG